MADTRQILTNLLAGGEIEKTLAALNSIFEKSGDITRLSRNPIQRHSNWATKNLSISGQIDKKSSLYCTTVWTSRG